jgi:hypothetical protein
MTKDLSNPKSWTRAHANGMIALVHETPFDEERYVVGALPAHGVASMGTVGGTLSEAKDAADQTSGCPQPCTCPPWAE